MCVSLYIYGNEWNMKWLSDNLTVLLVFLRRQRIVKRYPRTLYLLSFDSSVTVLRGNRVVGFVWFWMSIFYKWPCGLMDKAPASGAGNCRFKSCQGRRSFYISLPPYTMLPSIIVCVCHCTSTGNEWNMKMYVTILPDMLFCGLLIVMVIKQSDRIACLPA